MRRIRHTSAGLAPARLSRPVAALALSAALHVMLINGIALPSGSGSHALATVMHVRLEPAQQRRQLKVTPVALAAESAVAEGVAVAAAPAAHLHPAMVAPGLPNPAAAHPLPIPVPGVTAVDANPSPAGAVATSANSLADPVHYSASELDIFPRTLAPIAPGYPHAAIAGRSTGYVTLQVLIDEAGRVVDTAVLDAAPEGVFEEAAQQAITAASFSPAQKDGRIVRSRVLVKIEFDPESLDAAR